MKAEQQSYCYLLRAVSNMHVGSGNANYGVIDNLVQRDPITNYPCINASSLKGALREFFNYELTKHQNSELDKTKRTNFICEVFGNEREKDANPDFNAGAFHFDMAHLLAIPVRSDKVPFVMVTTVGIIQQFKEHLELFDANTKLKDELADFLKDFAALRTTEKAVVFDQSVAGVHLEEQDVTTVNKEVAWWCKVAQLLNTERWAIVSDEVFKQFVENLPVIARNQLDNGESKNLWYEEIVPRETRFYTIIQHDGWSDVATLTQCFNKTITNKLVQIGGNASVGYGKTKFSTL